MKLIGCMALITPFFLFTANGQKSTGYMIKGRIIGVPDRTKFYLIKRNEHNKPDTVAFAYCKSNEFIFRGVIELEGEPHYLKMDTSVNKITGGKRSYLTLFLDNSKIELDGSIHEWPGVTIEGSIPTTNYNEFLRVDIEKKKQLDSSMDNFEEKRKGYYEFLFEYASSNPNSYISPYCIYNVFKSLNPDNIEQVYENFTPAIKRSYFGSKLKNLIKTLKNRSDLSIGKAVPEFFVLTPKNKRMSVREIYKYSKYTLIDFWAWWCIPCRKDVPNMKNVFEKFHAKGFNILSVSTDPDRSKWIKAMAEDKTPWLHGMDVDNASTIIFDFGSIPAYILVDSTGKMIAVDCGISGFTRDGEKKLPGKSANENGDGEGQINDVNNWNRGLRKNLFEVIDELLNK